MHGRRDRPAADTDERVAAYHRVLRWAHVLAWQIHRLDATRQEAFIARERSRGSPFYGAKEAEPFHRLEADRHFTLTAARNLLRALRVFDGNLRLPRGLGLADVEFLRDSLEHWDDPNDRARNVEQLVDDRSLLVWAEQVYAELINGGARR
jgi:hypothetical protein